MTIGDHAPAFALQGVDGREHALEDYADAPALVLVQWCNHCPYVQSWEGRVGALQVEYADRGVRIVAVNSNDWERYPEDSFEEMRLRAERQAFPFDYLHDSGQDVARALASERTPEAFVFDGSRRLVYHGAVDDSRDAAKVQRTYLRDALDAVLAGRGPEVTETPPVGCTVKWRP